MRASTGLATVCGAMLLVSGGEILAHGPLTHTDRSIAVHYFLHSDHDQLAVAHWLDHIGQPWIACVVVGGMGLLWTMRSRRVGPGLAAVVGLGIVGVGTLLLKTVFPHWSIFHASDSSFPSGHTGVAVVSSGIVVALLLLRNRHRNAIVLTIAGLWGAVMAWGRLVILAHWLSDVVAGWGLGMIALIFALRVIDNPTPPRQFVDDVLRRAGSLRDRRGSHSPTPDGR